jgi:hypothetical protein
MYTATTSPTGSVNNIKVKCKRLLRVAVRESQLRERERRMGMPTLQEAALDARP